MRRWNGWGDEQQDYPLKSSAREFLLERVGAAKPLPDATLASVLAKVPDSRMPDHRLISIDNEQRVRHARGQSLPDWLAMRSGKFGIFPDGVACPQTNDEVRELLCFAQEQDIQVIPYGGGTSVVGHINPCASKRPVLTLSLARMNSLLALDKVSQIATFGAGTPGPEVEAQLNAQGYTLGHFPQSWELSTIGGWVASRSSGQQSLRYGRIEQLFAGGRIETLNGTMVIPTLPASSAGPDLRELFMGSEGRMGIITEVKVRVSRLPEQESFHVAFFPDWDAALTAVREIAQQKVPLSMVRLSNPDETYTQLQLAGHPIAIRALEAVLGLRGAGEDKCMLTFGVTGSKEFCRFALAQALRMIKRHRGVNTGTLLGKKWLENRFRSPYLRHGLWTAGYAVDTLETCVDWPQVTPLMQAIEAALRDGLQAEDEAVHVFTHLSHIYTQGSSIYTTYVFRCADTYEKTLARWQQLKAAACAEIVRHGGTISHQHGVGADHAPYLADEKGELGMAALSSVCRHFDPTGMLNPGKLIQDKRS